MKHLMIITSQFSTMLRIACVLAVMGWNQLVIAQSEVLSESQQLQNVFAFTSAQQISDESLAGMRGQGRDALAVSMQWQGVILWDEDSAEKGSSSRSVQQGNQITIQVNLEGQK